MTATTLLRGIWSAVVTPVDERYEPDGPRAVAYYRDLLQAGIDGINLLGTTGEAMSFSASQRLRLMEIVAASLPHERIMCGTGSASVEDAARLTGAASELGFCAALVMPPFFYRDANDDGIVRFFGAVLDRTGPLRCTVVLYNFPRMSGVTFSRALVERLNAEFPGIIGGMKDSSNDPALQRELIAHYPDLRIFPGSENYLFDAKAAGVAGCISGSVCLWPQLANDAFTSGEETLCSQVRDLRDGLAGAPLIAAVRERIAAARGDDAWLRSMPPN
jgi:4-hydroxy-tetrahydrodipicolinate synthase